MTPTSPTIATIAILDTKLSVAISEIAELKGRFDTFQSGFIRQDLYNIKHEELVKQCAENTAEIRNMKRDSAKSRWIVPTGSMVLGSVLTALVIYALTHR